MAELLKRTLAALLALIFMGAGFYFVLSIISYHPADPSWNTVVVSADGSNSVSASNILGYTGAVIADIAHQMFGSAAWLLPALCFAWAVLTVKRGNFSNGIWRFVAGFTALVFASLAGEAILASGGTVGLLLYAYPQIWGEHYAFPYTAPITGITSYAIAAGLFIWAAGIRLDMITKTASRMTYSIAWLFQFAAPLYRLRLKSRNEFLDFSDDDNVADDDHTEAPVVPRRKKAQSAKIVTTEKGKGTKSREDKPLRQQSLGFDKNDGDWVFPALELLQEPPLPLPADQTDEASLRKNAELLQNVLADFNVKGDIVSIHPGPVVTLYELEPAPGTKSSRVIGLSDDIARSMAALSVRSAVVPGRNVIGIELPNKRRQTVYLRELLESKAFADNQAKLALILGKDIGGQPIIADLARMPHLLVAGTTGSGKSVAVNTMILSLLYRLTPEQCRFIMIDPKMLELSVYNDIPHLLAPVVTEAADAIIALKWTVQEMENRYRLMSKLGVRNIEGYNHRLREAAKKGETLTRKVQTGYDADTGKPVFEDQPYDMQEIPYIVVVVDEFADLMLVAGKDVENAIQRLAQMARAAGIHLIMATQRPSVDVITGVIKANFPTRISFQVTSRIDSRTILGESGAEQLLGMGDMLYMISGGRIARVHGPFVTDSEVEDVVTHLREQREPDYVTGVTDGDFADDTSGSGGGSSVDELYQEAVSLVLREGKASTSFIQRHLQIGYNRAARIIEEMEKQGVVSQANHVGKREVLGGR